MILPIYIYGTPVLRQPTEEITANYPDLQALIDNMLDTCLLYTSDAADDIALV